MTSSFRALPHLKHASHAHVSFKRVNEFFSRLDAEELSRKFYSDSKRFNNYNYDYLITICKHSLQFKSQLATFNIFPFLKLHFCCVSL